MTRYYAGNVGVPFGRDHHVVTYRESRTWWLLIGPLFGWIIGLANAWLIRGVVGFVVGIAIVVAGAFGLVWWARWSSRAQLHCELLAELVDKTYGVMARDRAVVVIRPGDHPEVDGVVEVHYPPGGDDEASGLREP